MRVHFGLAIWPRRSSMPPALDWGMEPLATRNAEYNPSEPRLDFDWRGGGLEVRTEERSNLHYRIGPQGVSATAPMGASPPCGEKPYPILVTDAFTLYEASAGKDHITSTTVCHCSAARGCVKTTLPGFPTPISATDDGTFATISTNGYGTLTTLTIRAPGRAPVSTKLPASCIRGAFGPHDHLFLACEAAEHEELVELAVPALTVVRRHALPPIGRVSEILRAGDALLVMNAGRTGSFGALLDAAWLDAPTHEPPMLYAWPTFGIRQDSDGKLTLYGDERAAGAAIRCYDGAKLSSFDACREPQN